MKDRERRRSIERSRIFYFPSREVTPYYKGFLADLRINFGKKHINFSPYTTIGKNRILIKFPNGVIYKERLSLKESATFLDIPIARIKEMMEKGDLSYWLPQEGQEIMLSRRSLLEWKYQKTTGSICTDDKSNQKEKAIRIVLSERDYERYQEYKKLRGKKKKESSLINPEARMREN